MKDRIQRFFTGRQGMDEFSKSLFWYGLGLFAAAILTAKILKGVLSGIFLWLAIVCAITSFVRAFSRNTRKRELENNAYLALKAQRRQKLLDAKDRFSQRKSYKFFKCPGCKQYLRVPKGKGKIHINCKCGYTLYRKT